MRKARKLENENKKNLLGSFLYLVLLEAITAHVSPTK